MGGLRLEELWGGPASLLSAAGHGLAQGSLLCATAGATRL